MNKTTPREANPVLTVILSLMQATCCYFTVFAVLLILIQWAMAGTLEDTVIAVDAFFMLLPLSLAFSAARKIRRSAGLSKGIKAVLHPVLCMGGIFLAYLPYLTQNNFPASSVLVHMVVFLVAYGLVTAGIYVISLATRRHREDKEVYENKFIKKEK